MRIGIDASNTRSGGMIAHVAELLAHCDPERHGVTKVTIWGSAALLERVPHRPWLDRVHVPWLDRRLPWRVAWQLFARSRLARASCDVLFAPGASPIGTFRPHVSMSANLLPFVARERARNAWSREWLRVLLLRALQGHAFRESSAVIFLTDHARTLIASVVGLDANARTSVIPAGVNDRFRAEPRTARPLSSYDDRAPFRFLYVSDIHPYKHPWNVAEAVGRLRREGLPVAIDFIGSPVHRASTRRFRHTLSRLGAEKDSIRFLGPLPYDALPAMYRDADAFVFASTCENLPMTLVEAMASGLPIAASDTRPMPDILADAAFYFDAENVSSIEAALRALALDPARRATIAKRAHAAAARYSWDECADRTFALLADIARQHHGSGDHRHETA